LVAAWVVFLALPLWVFQPARHQGRRPGRVSTALSVAEAAPVAPVVARSSTMPSPEQAKWGPSEIRSTAPAKAVESRPDVVSVPRNIPGRELFLREWLPGDSRSHGGDGLGQVYNDSSCVACHNLGGVGGGGPNGKNVDILSVADRGAPQSGRAPARHGGGAGGERLEAIHPGFRNATSVVLHRFGNAPEYALWRLDRLGAAVAGSDHVGPGQVPNAPPELLAKIDVERSRLRAVSPGLDAMMLRRASRPSVARVARSQRNTTALFGAGMIDAIPDRFIVEASLTSYPEFPEVRGRVSRLEDGRVGRFGWKAQVATLREFVMTACAVELGLEVPDHPQGGNPMDPRARAEGLDLTDADCDALVAFVATLPRPVQQVPAAVAESIDLGIGERTFKAIGCATCHTPSLGGVQGIYSDLLLHDMGEDSGDTGSYRAFQPGPSESEHPVPGPVAGASRREWRTPPLWGLRDSAPYLHDGRADTIEQAIALHGGQGAGPARRYFGLSPLGRQEVQAFLKSLVAPGGLAPYADSRRGGQAPAT
jgi:CxxC motif-containing protein (DUF1111 family)